MVHPGHLWPPGPAADGLADLRRVVSTRGLEVVTLNMPNIDINIAAAAPAMREYSLAMVTGIVRLASEIGARGVVHWARKGEPAVPG